MANAGLQETQAPYRLVESAYDHILEGILSCRLKGGDVIQEARLCLSLGLSRTPVREALGRLEGEGLLTRNGRVLMVRTVSLAEYFEVLQLRRIVEGEAASLACGRAPRPHLEALYAKIDAMQDPHAVTPAEHWDLDNELHQTLAVASGNELMARLVADLRRKTQLFNLKRIPDRFVPGRLEHLAILKAVLDGDRDGARQAMLNHLEQTKQGIIAAMAHL